MKSTDYILIDDYKHIRYKHQFYEEEVMLNRSHDFLELLQKRRSIRDFSDKEVPKKLIETIIKTAATSPSGANKQPWTFCIVKNSDLKQKIRMAAEDEERKSYNERMSEKWLNDLKKLGTDSNKPFLEKAPYLIVVFKHIFEYDVNGNKLQNYYVNESVGLACGMLIAAIQNAGLCTLTHTPSPMRFLEKILNRPDNERAFLLLPIGYPAEKTYVPDIQKKSLIDVIKWY